MILVDTNVVSEFMKPDLDDSVVAWAEGIRPDEMFYSAITVQEIEYGIGRLPTGKRRQRLRVAWSVFQDRYVDALVPYDRAAAERTAELLVKAAADGLALSWADAQIAGTAMSRGHVLATRNIKDFIDIDDLRLVDPFSA